MFSAFKRNLKFLSGDPTTKAYLSIVNLLRLETFYGAMVWLSELGSVHKVSSVIDEGMIQIEKEWRDQIQILQLRHG